MQSLTSSINSRMLKMTLQRLKARSTESWAPALLHSIMISPIKKAFSSSKCSWNQLKSLKSESSDLMNGTLKVLQDLLILTGRTWSTTGGTDWLANGPLLSSWSSLVSVWCSPSNSYSSICPCMQAKITESPMLVMTRNTSPSLLCISYL